MLNKAFASAQTVEAPSRHPGDRSGRTSAPSAEPFTGLDAKALDKLRQLDPTGANRFVERILVTYQKSAARLESRLAEARREADIDAIHLVVHTLKSSSAHVGALTLAKTCDAIEKAIVSKSGVDLNTDLDRMSRELAVALSAVAERLGATS